MEIQEWAWQILKIQDMEIQDLNCQILRTWDLA